MGQTPNMADCRKKLFEDSNIKSWESQLNSKDNGKDMVEDDDFCLCDRCGKIMVNLMAMATKREMEMPVPVEST